MRKAVVLLLGGIALALLTGACVGGPNAGLVAPVNAQGQTQTQSTPAPTPTLVPAPTPVPAPSLSQLYAEYIVLADLSACLDQVSIGPQGSTRVAFESSYDHVTRAWNIRAETSDGRLTLGIWEVEDRSAPFATAADPIAQEIASGQWACVHPPVLLDGEPTPPRFVEPADALAEERLLTGPQAAVRVWVATADCYTPRPEANVFTATQENLDRWVVEGRDDSDALYGLWLVAANTGQILALDVEARSVIGRTCFQRLGS